MKSAAGRLEALAHWVASDHFEELGRPPKLFHGGFGLLSVGNLRKPRWWALELANRLGDEELAAKVEGDAGGVEVWAARRDDGTIGILAWNGTLNQSKADGDPDLARTITLTVAGLGEGDHTVTHHRIDERHSNIRAHWHGKTRTGRRMREWRSVAEGKRPGGTRPAGHDDRLDPSASPSTSRCPASPTWRSPLADPIRRDPGRDGARPKPGFTQPLTWAPQADISGAEAPTEMAAGHAP